MLIFGRFASLAGVGKMRLVHLRPVRLGPR